MKDICFDDVLEMKTTPVFVPPVSLVNMSFIVHRGYAIDISETDTFSYTNPILCSIYYQITTYIIM
jgi:hypothetical protein